MAGNLGRDVLRTVRLLIEAGAPRMDIIEVIEKFNVTREAAEILVGAAELTLKAERLRAQYWL